MQPSRHYQGKHRRFLKAGYICQKSPSKLSKSRRTDQYHTGSHAFLPDEILNHSQIRAKDYYEKQAEHCGSSLLPRSCQRLPVRKK